MIKIADFGSTGVGRINNIDGTISTHTNTNKGTNPYSAPETLSLVRDSEGEMTYRYSTASEIYSIGLIAYSLFHHNKTIYNGEEEIEILKKLKTKRQRSITYYNYYNLSKMILTTKKHS